MSNPGVQEEQLLELLLQLKKTTPDSARAILNSQPQIAYALMAVMVNMNAVKVDVIQKTLADFTANVAVAAPPAQPAAVAPPTRPMAAPEPARPPPTMPAYGRVNPPTHPRNGSAPPTGPSYYGRTGAAPSYPPGPPQPPQPQLSYPPPQSGPPPGYGVPLGAPPPFQLPPAFANIPEDQKALLMKVVTMTPDEIHRKPPHERSSLIHLRQTLGLPI